MSDLMHEPIAVHHPYESHFIGGALVGLGVDALLDRRRVSQPVRLVSSVLTALVVGTAKEYLVDKKPRNWEIGPWPAGAAAVSAFWEVKW